MAYTLWTMKLYDTDGNGISANDMNLSVTSSNQIKHATGRRLEFALNGIDQLGFSLYLDDPMAAQIARLRTVVKVWRTVKNSNGTTIYSDGASSPCFAGVVASTSKQGAANTMSVRAFSPIWRLQFRFHLLNHYLKTNPDTAAAWTQSELMWKLIDLVNNAFGLSNSNTGIVKGTFSSPSEVTVSPYFVGKGSNTYTNIFDDIMTKAAGVDVIPEYYHADGSPTMMRFSTDDKRGEDVSGSVDLRYRTGSSDNLEDLTEEEVPVPGEFANYLWAVGHGGPNSGKIAMEENIDDDADGYNNIGIYMRRADFDDIKLIGSLGPPATHLKAIAQAEFAQSRVPKTNYTAQIATASDVTYGYSFGMGDVVKLNAAKGALSVTNAKNRIYNITLDNSDNNMETPTITIAQDFYGKVAP